MNVKVMLLLICWFLWYLVMSSRAILAPLLPVIELEFMTSHALAGSLFLSFTIGMTISYLFISKWLNFRAGYKRAILLSLLFMTVFIFLIGYSRSYGELAVLCFIVGLGSGVYMPAAIPILTCVFEPQHWGRVLSIHDTGAAAASVMLPLLISFSLSYVKWRFLFFILSLTLLLFTVLFWWLSPNPEPEEKTAFSWRLLLTRRIFWIILAIFTMVAVANNALYSMTPLFLIHERGFDLETANRIFGYTRIGSVVMPLLISLIIDRRGAKPVMWMSLLSSGLSILLLAVVHRPGWIIAALLLQAMFCVVTYPAVFFAVSKLSTLNERGAFMSLTMGIGLLVGAGFSPVLVGAIADRWSFEVGILLVGTATILSCLLVRWLPKV